MEYDNLTTESPTVMRQRFPLTCVSMDVFMKMDRLLSYGELVDRGQAVVPKSQDYVHIISHQWLSNTHPDPQGVQLRRLQEVFAVMIAGRAEELFTEEDWPLFLKGVSKGTGKAVEQIEAASAARELLTSELVEKHVRHGHVWIDYCSIPQIQDGSASSELIRRQQRDAIYSIPAYVERCKYFWVLSPKMKHADTGAICDFNSWRSRGWCRLEEWANCLSIQQRMPLVISDAPKLATVGTIDFMFANMGRPEKAVCMGDFSCCQMNHVVTLKDGRVVQIPCDKLRVGRVLKQMCNAKLSSWRCSGQRLMYGLLRCLEQTLYTGTQSEIQAPEPNESLDAFLSRICFSDLNDRNEVGDTPLHWAMMLAHPDLVRRILQQHPDLLAIRNNIGFSALSMGVFRRDNDLSAMLNGNHGFVSSIELNATTAKGVSALHRAAKGGFKKHVSLLLECKAEPEIQRHDNGRTPLLSAAEAGYAECCAVLLRHGALVNASGHDGNTCLHLAAYRLTLIGNLNPGAKLAVAEELIDARADIVRRNAAGRTPMEIAEQEGFSEYVDLLRQALEQGAGAPALRTEANSGSSHPSRPDPAPLASESYANSPGCPSSVTDLAPRGAE